MRVANSMKLNYKEIMLFCRFHKRKRAHYEQKEGASGRFPGLAPPSTPTNKPDTGEELNLTSQVGRWSEYSRVCPANSSKIFQRALLCRPISPLFSGNSLRHPRNRKFCQETEPKCWGRLNKCPQRQLNKSWWMIGFIYLIHLKKKKKNASRHCSIYNT